MRLVRISVVACSACIIGACGSNLIKSKHASSSSPAAAPADGGGSAADATQAAATPTGSLSLTFASSDTFVKAEVTIIPDDANSSQIVTWQAPADPPHVDGLKPGHYTVLLVATLASGDVKTATVSVTVTASATASATFPMAASAQPNPVSTATSTDATPTPTPAPSEACELRAEPAPQYCLAHSLSTCTYKAPDGTIITSQSACNSALAESDLEAIICTKGWAFPATEQAKVQCSTGATGADLAAPAPATP